MNNIEYVKNYRKLIAPFEVDFYLFEHDIAIEVCGLYWHSTKINKNKYHILDKYNLCKAEGVRLLTIFEDEIRDSLDIVLNRLANILKLNKSKLYARKCTIRQITNVEGINFLNTHHIQRSGRNKIYLGAFLDNKLISVMSFSNLNPAKGRSPTENHYELNRFANPFGVVGIASRLFAYFKNNFAPIKIISYADLRWNTGGLYELLGFTFIRQSRPNYWYINKVSRVHRWSFTKHKLLGIIPNADKNCTEEQLAESINLYRVYDCGNAVYEWKK